MSALDFPLNPTNGQTYTLNGVNYEYNSTIGAWLTKSAGSPLPSATNAQILFNDNGLSNGSFGLVFDKSANTLITNAVKVGGSAIPSGATSNLAFDTANAAFGKANTSLQNTSGTFVGNLAISGNVDLSLTTTALKVPTGNTSQRPVGSIGMIRYNTETDALENYTAGSGWIKVAVQVPSILTQSGTIYSGAVSNVSFTGTGFGTTQSTITFTSGVTVATSNAIPTGGGTALTVPVPLSIYGLSASSVVTVKITNADGGQSSNVSYTIIGLPTGGTITTSGTNRIHTFTSSSDFVVPTGFTATASYLIVAGGGGGGNGNASNDGNGGGGAGGLLSGTFSISAATYAATVGSGGAGGAVGSNAGTNGGNSSLFGLTSIGGGGGGTDSGAVGSGGSGGGASCSGASVRTGGSGTAGQGFAGGSAGPGGGPGGGGGGGGGAGAVGATAVGSNSNGGNGGIGVLSSISGTSYYYGGGGGGSTWTSNGGNGGLGGGGGGGSRIYSAGTGGGSAVNSGSNGSGASGGAGGTNTGGGGGSGTAGGSAGTGGSGVVVVSYPIT